MKPIPKPVTPEISSDSDDTEILDPQLDVPVDAMVPGYDDDDAYIMVEHDLLEAAKQVTRHLHLEAYQKNASAPAVQGDIIRPTTSAPKRAYSRNVHDALQVAAVSDEEDEDAGKNVTSLGQLLRRRPVALVPATPIKRQEKNQLQKKENRLVESRGDVKEKKVEPVIPRPPSRGTDADDEDDEDDEDLDRPRKVRNLTNTANRQISKLSTQSSLPSFKLSAVPIRTTTTKKESTNKLSTTLDPDWIFSSFWDDDVKRPAKPAGIKRGKVSLADQLQESSFKMFEKKKAISLKDQFKFMER